MFAALSPSCIIEDAMLDILSTTSAISFSSPITETSNDRHDVWNYRSIEFVQQFDLADNNEISKVRVTVHLSGESTSDRWFPAQRVSNTENMSIRWRHNVKVTSLHSSCFIAVSIVPVVISIIESIPLLNYRMYVLFSRANVCQMIMASAHLAVLGIFLCSHFQICVYRKNALKILYQITFYIKTAKCWAQNALRTYRRDYSSERLRGTRSARCYHGEVSHRFWCATIWQFFAMDSLSVDRFSFAFWEV